ncbi:hypothetical protein L9F63_001669, partial [Diploptera punctata]
MEEVRLLVQEEGRAARNLIAFHVPVDHSLSESGKVLTRKPPTSPRLPSDGKKEDGTRFSKRSCESPKPGSRVRSASTGRDKKSELQARYWAFLFGNLQRAVDEIYQTCETDESVSECKEVILVLENYTRDFHNLIEWFKLKWEYENTPPPQRPTSLAWEVRKSSPGKMRPLTIMIHQISHLEKTVTSEDSKGPGEISECENKSEAIENNVCNVETVKGSYEDSGCKLETIVKNDSEQSEGIESKNCDSGEPIEMPVMVHQASQTDLEESVKPAPVINKTVTNRISVAPPRIGVRTTSMTPNVKPQPLVRPAYAAVSRLSSPATTKSLASSVAPRPYISPRLVRSRTSTDVRSAGRGTTLRKESSSTVLKPQRPAALTRQNRPGMQQVASIAPKIESIPEKGPSLDRRSGSNSSLNSSASSGARSWADKNNMRDRWTDGQMLCRSGELFLPPSLGELLLPPSLGSDVMLIRRTASSSLSWDRWTDVMSIRRTASSSLSWDRCYVDQENCFFLPLLGQMRTASSSLSWDRWTDENCSFLPLLGQMLCRSGELLPPSLDDTQGWETVKSRSRAGNIKAYSAKSRFQQPSAATSLPALALIEVEVRPPTVKDGKKIADLKRSKDNKKPMRTKSSLGMNKKINSRESIDKQEKAKDENESPVEEEKKESVELKENQDEKDVEELDKNEDVDLEIEKSTVSDIQDEKLKLEDILEEKSLFDEEELRKSKELCAEEAMLRKEIQELETTEIEVDTETDETETDGEATIGPDDDDEDDRDCETIDNHKIPIIDDNMTLEARYEPQLEGMSWAERVDALEQLEEMEARHPGRALELHQKLSSPSRRRTLPETLRCFQAKQAQAKEKRERLMQEKSQKLRELLNKVEEVKAAQAQLIEDKRTRLEMKLKRAEVNRKLHLKGIVRKAHDEEEKLKEIAFINELEAQNKRHDFMALCQERLEEMQEMRRKREERVGRKQQEREKERQELAREKARDREERLSALHAAQLANQEELQKKIQQKQEESARRHEENIEHIRQRALESSILRCSTDDVAPRLAPYDTQKLCEICNVLIGSEVYLLSHLRGRKHQEAVQHQHEGIEPSREDLASYNLKHIVDAPADKIDPKIALDKERQKALKKRCKKIRLRMAVEGQEYESKRDPPTKIESPDKARIQKCLRDIDKQHSTQGKGQWPNTAITALERALGSISRILDKKNALDQKVFQALNGFSTLSNILNLALDVPANMAPYLPSKCFVTTCNTYMLACRDHAANSKYVLCSNKISNILDLLLFRLTTFVFVINSLDSQNTENNS